MPILRHELTLIARRQRVTLWRCLFAATLAVMAAIMYAGAANDSGPRFGKRELAEITQYVALALFFILFGIGATLTPQWTADAIAGERERQTLPFLLLTPLSGRSIILGKLGARLMQVGVFLLAGLPILGALQFFGGIDPDLLLLGIAALSATVVSTACITVLTSVYARSTKTAAQRAGQVLAVYFVGMLMLGQVLRHWPHVANFPGPASAVTVHDVYDWVNIGNPIAVVNGVIERFGTGAPFVDAIIPVIRDYVAFHALVAVTCVLWAIRKVRPISAEQGDGSQPASKNSLKQALPRPPVSERRPVTWKMRFCDHRMAKTRWQRGFARFVFVLGFAPLALTIGFCLSFGNADELPAAVNAVMRGLVTLALCGALIHIAGQASVSVARERVKRTLDELLLTDLSNEDILHQKWLGAVLSVRWLLVWVVLHWVVGIVTGGLHPLAVVPLTLLWIVYAISAATLGIYCTARWSGMKECGLWSGLMGLAVGIGPLVVTVILVATRQRIDEFLLIPTMMTPPAALGACAFAGPELFRPTSQPSVFGYIAIGIVLGVLWNLVFLRVWWTGARRWFPKSVGRE